MKKDERAGDAYIIEGKLALPYTYLAGRVGSKFITTIRDKNTILGIRCQKCDKVFVPPRQTCDVCMDDIRNNWVELDNVGELVNFTIVRYDDKHLPRKAPYILGMIKLGGADTLMAHIVEGISPGEVQLGMKLKPVFAQDTTNTILDIDHFEPA